MYQPLLTKETMLPQQQHTNFERDPHVESFHDLFARLVAFRSNTVNSAVSKLINAHAIQTEVKLPDASGFFKPSFDMIVENAVPMVNAKNPIDEENLLAKSGAISVEKIDTKAASDLLDLASETEDERVAAARQHLAYIETLTTINQVNTLDDSNFTLAA